MTKKIVFSFFSGSGFLDLGFETNGFDIDLVNEYSPEFMRAYQYSRERMGLRKPRFGYYNIDINEFLTTRMDELRGYINLVHSEGNLVGFIGGPPCPDFSIAGKNRGRNGDNGKLSKSYADLIISMQPDFFLFENVKGLYRTAKHREFFELLKSKFRKAGYALTEKLVNAIEYGAPQDRERIILIGFQKSKAKQLNIPVKKTELLDFPWDKYKNYSIEQIKECPWPKTSPFQEGIVTTPPAGIINELTVECWWEKNDVTHHPNASMYFQPRAALARFNCIEEGDDLKKSFKRLHRWRYSPTAAYGNNEVHIHPYKPRRISVSEALAIQSLPKEFELPLNVSLTDAFKSIGNGVPFLLANCIAKSIYLYIN